MGWLDKTRQIWTRHQMQRDYEAVFGTPEGARVLNHLAKRCYVLSAHDGSPYWEGQRSVVLEIMSILRRRPEDLQLVEIRREDD